MCATKDQDNPILARENRNKGAGSLGWWCRKCEVGTKLTGSAVEEQLRTEYGVVDFPLKRLPM